MIIKRLRNIIDNIPLLRRGGCKPERSMTQGVNDSLSAAACPPTGGGWVLTID